MATAPESAAAYTTPRPKAMAEFTIGAPTAKPRVIIDCDPGNDDMFAIGVAAITCDVVAITAVAGNSPLANTANNALVARELMDLDTTEVHSGADAPLARLDAEFAVDAHGLTGLGGAPRTTPKRALDGTDAVGYILDRTRQEEGLWLVALGPLTNIALALRADPTLPDRVAGLSFMGGSTTHGNMSQVAEFNIYFDPEAAAEVLERRWPEVRMFGLNVTHQVQAGSEMVRALKNADTERSRFCAGLLEFSQAFNAKVYGLSGADVDLATAPMHDPCAVLGVARPDLFAFAARHVCVETAGVHTRAMTIVDERPWRYSGAFDGTTGPYANVNIAMRPVDAAAALALVQRGAL